MSSRRVRFHRSERVRYSTESVESWSPTARRGERKWRKKSEEGWTGRPLTSRQSGSAEVSMTPVRRRSADAARRDRDAASRVAHRLSSEEIIIMVLRAIRSENTVFSLAFRIEGRVAESERSRSESIVSVKSFYAIFFYGVRKRAYRQNYQLGERTRTVHGVSRENIPDLVLSKCR